MDSSRSRRALAQWLLSVLTLVPAVSVAAPGSQGDVLLESLTPAGYVSDFAGVMGERREPVEELLTELEQKTGAEVGVVTLRSLEGTDIDDFAVRLFERWGIGQAGRDNGVLLIAAIEDRNVRIEVGYGLEPVINDARAGRLLDEAVIPYFRNEDYGSGLASGAASIAGLIATEAGVELTGIAAVQVSATQRDSNRPEELLPLVLLLLFILLLWRHPWLALLFLSGQRGGGFPTGGGFGRGRGGGFGGFGGGMSGGGGAGRSW